MSMADKVTAMSEYNTTIAENVPKVYDAGKKAEYDRLWDCLQENGKRTSYHMAFCGTSWTDDTFKPKYDIKTTGSIYQLFFSSQITDLIGILEKCGVVLDTSNVTGTMEYAFGNTKITRLPAIDVTKSSNTHYVFYSNKVLKTIDKIIVAEDTVINSWFNGTTALENLTIEGIIGQNGFDIHWSTKLSKASITSIINALSTTATGLTVTLSKTAVNNAFGIDVDDEATWGEGTEYYTLRHSKDNWTISYV